MEVGRDHDNGNIFTENSFKSGVYDGSSSEWHENGLYIIEESTRGKIEHGSMG